MVPVFWLIVIPSLILKFPPWSVLVKGTLPPSVATIWFSSIATAPLEGIELTISVPVPIYSNVIPDAIILLAWKKLTVAPTETG